MKGRHYLTSYGNWLEWVPNLILLVTLINHLTGNTFEYLGLFFRFHALASLLFWFKTAFYLSYFKATGYLILSIVEIIKDMVPFLIILTATVIGFAQAFWALSSAKEHDEVPTEPFLDSWQDALKFSYEMMLGDFDAGTFDLPTYVCFFLATMLQLVVMLNVLIAIVSDSFARVSGAQVHYTYV